MKLPARLGATCLACLAGVARSADGDLDPSFSTDGLALVSWPYSIGSAKAAVAADGSIFHGTTELREVGAEINMDFAISKFRPDGSLDPTFGFFGQRSIGIDAVVNGSDLLLGMFPLPGGGVLLAGGIQGDPGYRGPGLVRLTPDGDADPSFGTDGRQVITHAPWPEPAGVQVIGVTQQGDGKLVFAGVCTDCAGARLVIAVRLTANGELDPTFADGGWFGFDTQDDADVSVVAIDPWGRIVLGGTDGTDADPDDRPWLMRLTPSGQADPTFGAGTGISFLEDVPSFGLDWNTTSIAIDTDGSIVLALNNNRAGIARAREDGSLDTSFADGGFRDLNSEMHPRIQAVAIRSDHRIVVAGSLHPSGGEYDEYLARLHADGSFDDDFAANGLLAIDTSRAKTTPRSESHSMPVVWSSRDAAAPTAIPGRCCGFDPT